LPERVDGLTLHDVRAGGGTASIRSIFLGDGVKTEVIASDGLEMLTE
jgi:hypothetical protein